MEIDMCRKVCVFAAEVFLSVLVGFVIVADGARRRNELRRARVASPRG